MRWRAESGERCHNPVGMRGPLPVIPPYLDYAAGVEHGRVVVAKGPTDARQGPAERLTNDPHSELPRLRHLCPMAALVECVGWYAIGGCARHQDSLNCGLRRPHFPLAEDSQFRRDFHAGLRDAGRYQAVKFCVARGLALFEVLGERIGTGHAFPQFPLQHGQGRAPELCSPVLSVPVVMMKPWECVSPGCRR
jgi:hypothetical protein